VDKVSRDCKEGGFGEVVEIALIAPYKSLSIVDVLDRRSNENINK
jgi:hypothetical protein